MEGHTAWEITGSGPGVVLVHGLGLNRHMWQWQLPALTNNYRVLSYDLYGQGDSEKLPGPYPMDRMTRQIADLMDEAGLDQAALIGFSLGGLIVRAFALRYPERVSALVILNSAHARSKEEREAILKRVQQVETEGPASTVDAALERWFSKDFAGSGQAVINRVREWVLGNDPGTYPAMYRLLAEGDIGLEERIVEIQCPTLVMTGEEDYGNSVAMAEGMAGLIPDSELVVLPGLRHMALAEDPATVNTVLTDFLGRRMAA